MPPRDLIDFLRLQQVIISNYSYSLPADLDNLRVRLRNLHGTLTSFDTPETTPYRIRDTLLQLERLLKSGADLHIQFTEGDINEKKFQDLKIKALIRINDLLVDLENSILSNHGDTTQLK